MTAPILVTGGTGTLGVHVVQRLKDRGCQVRVVSRKQRAGSEGLEYVVGDLVQGTGIAEAVAGVKVIVHCASAKKGDVAAAKNLVSAARAQKIPPHLVYISIVGATGVPFGYFQTKLATEEIVVDSGLPWTLQRATQFYDFIFSGAKSMTRLPVVPVPSGFRCQPIDPAEVAEKLVALALGPPSGRVPDIGGPESSTWAEMIRRYLRVTKRKRACVEVWMPKMKEIRSGCLLVGGDSGRPSVPYGKTTWEQFLHQHLQ
jgi:uncharacterized protein YbjT (DUF2867 family)